MRWMQRLEERRFLSVSVSGSVVTVQGTPQNDDIVVRVDPNNTDNFQIYDQQSVKSIARSSARSIVVNAGDGADRLFIDHGNGAALRPFGRLDIRFDGGAGGDRLITLGDADGAPLHEILSFGASPGKGTFTTLRAGSLARQTVSFTRVDEVMGLSPAASLSVLGNNGANLFELRNGALTNAQQTGRLRMIDVRPCKRHDNELIVQQAHTPLVFANKRVLSVQAAKDKDLFDVNVPARPAALQSLHLHGGPGRDALARVTLDDEIQLYRRRIERADSAFNLVNDCPTNGWRDRHDKPGRHRGWDGDRDSDDDDDDRGDDD